MVSRSFGKDLRLRKAADFGRVFAQPIRVANRYFTLLARPNDCRAPRLGLAIAKRRIHRAARRNQLKRIVRESFRHHCHDLGGLDCVVLAGPGAADADARTLRGAADALWPRILSQCAGSCSA